MAEDAGRDPEMLEFAMVVLVYDRLCSPGVGWLDKVAFCKL